MEAKNKKFEVQKKQLKNGMTILVRPTHHIPEVDIQIWYNVGSKDERAGERGMAHLIEHMLFKGTDKLSETDINVITSKLSGYSNAFTSYDYTGYLFKFPRNVWSESLPIFADCMQNARFEEQMLFSEVKTVVQELKMYKDDYHSALIERMMTLIFTKHPYHYPIIGYKDDLLALTRDDLFAFYKKHYHPGNATLVVVGDVDAKEVFEKAEKEFGSIPAQKDYKKLESFFCEDVENTAATLYRAVENPVCLYTYKTPGAIEEKSYLFDMASLILSNGRSSRLYKKLVNEKQLAVDVYCFSYGLFEKGLFFIGVQPKKESDINEIEKIINEEIKKIIETPLEDWEFTRIQKRAQMSYLSLLESNNSQASAIGESYLSTGKTDCIDRYLINIKKTTKKEIQSVFANYFKASVQHKGFLLPAKEEEKKELLLIQERSDELDQEILSKFVRTSEIEPAKTSNNIEQKFLEKFEYPSPKEFTLENGLEIIFLHNPHVPQISVTLNFAASYLNESDELGGVSTLMSRMFLEGTKSHPGDELSKFIETQGIQIGSYSGSMALKFLSEDLETGFKVLYEILTEPEFKDEHIKKVQQNMLLELKDFWDTPLAFVNQLAKDAVYKDHPYRKNSLGTKESVEKLSHDDVVAFFKKYISPHDATLVVVGDLSLYKEEKFKNLIQSILGKWQGPEIKQLEIPELSYTEPQTIKYEIDRDQVVIALAAPSITRLDKNFYELAILDTVLTGGASGAMSSRLFQLREQTGLFYSIGGSLLLGSDRGPGMQLIKTIVSCDQVEKAEKIIKNEIKLLGQNGITEEELFMAANDLIASSVRLFESNMQIAQTFLFIKKCGLEFDLFDKRGDILSIINLGDVKSIAEKLCRNQNFSQIRVGRNVGKGNVN